MISYDLVNNSLVLQYVDYTGMYSLNRMGFFLSKSLKESRLEQSVFLVQSLELSNRVNLFPSRILNPVHFRYHKQKQTATLNRAYSIFTIFVQSGSLAANGNSHYSTSQQIPSCYLVLHSRQSGFSILGGKRAVQIPQLCSKTIIMKILLSNQYLLVTHT